MLTSGRGRHFAAEGLKKISKLAVALALCSIGMAVCCSGTGAERRCSTVDANAQGQSNTNGGRLQYMASIRRHGTRQHVCSGVLVDQWHILAPAHCVQPNSPYSAGPRPVVYVGLEHVEAVVDTNVEVLKISETIIHEKWSPDQGQRSCWNIAILKTEQASQKQAPTVLIDHFQLSSGQGLASIGFGVGENGPALGHDIFGAVKIEDMQFVDAKLCNRSTLWDGGLPGDMLCGLNRGAKASCIVDSGSPLVLLDAPTYNVSLGDPRLDFVAGINVDGAPCGVPGKPDIFIDLRPHASWISQHTKWGASRKCEGPS